MFLNTNGRETALSQPQSDSEVWQRSPMLRDGTSLQPDYWDFTAAWLLGLHCSLITEHNMDIVPSTCTYATHGCILLETPGLEVETAVCDECSVYCADKAFCSYRKVVSSGNLLLLVRSPSVLSTPLVYITLECLPAVCLGGWGSGSL